MIEPEVKHLVAIERALRARRGFRQTLDEVKNADFDGGFRADEGSDAPDADWGPIERACLTDFAKAVLNA